MNLDVLSIAALHGTIGFVVVWAICRILPRMPADWRCWLWRLVCLKFLLALLVSFPIHLTVDEVSPSFLATPSPAGMLVARLAPPGFGKSKPESETKPLPEANIAATNWWQALSVVWYLGFLLVAGRSILAWSRARSIRRASRREDIAPALFQRIGVRTKVEIRTTAGLDVPAVVGVFRPAILIPDSRSVMSTLAIEAALAHELSHIRRKDLAWTLVGEVCKAIFWFHPFAWLACREQHAEAEIAADRMARAWVDQSPREYGRHLLSWLDTNPHPKQTAGLLLATHELDRRLKAMSLTPYRRSISLAVSFALLVPLAFGLAPVHLLPRQGVIPEQGAVVKIPTSVRRQVVLIPPDQTPEEAMRSAEKSDLNTVDNPQTVRAIRRLDSDGTGGAVYSAPLVGGGRIELLGISHLEPGRSRSWSADGTPLPRLLPFTPTSGIPFREMTEVGRDGKTVRKRSHDRFGRQALIRISPGYLGANGDFFVEEGSRVVGGGISNTMPIPGRFKGDPLLVVEQGFSGDAKEADLVIHYFRALQSIGNSRVKDGHISAEGKAPHADFVPLSSFEPANDFLKEHFQASDKSFLLCVDKPADGHDALRAKLFDQSGQPIFAFNVGPTWFKNSDSLADKSLWLIPEGQISRIAEIRYSVTRNEQVRFQGVQLHPH